MTQQQNPVVAQQPATSPLAVTALVLGILSLIMIWLPGVGGFVGLAAAIAAIVFGSMGVSASRRGLAGRGLAEAGRVLGIVTAALALLIAIIYYM